MTKLILRTLQILILVAGAGYGPLASAKLFRNAYVSFELPPNWDCKLEGAEWVCENAFSKKQKEAIIILTAKEVGPADTLANYTSYLQTAKTLPGKSGSPTKSKVISVQQRTISNQLWIDGMHEGSEVAAYFTRYMATIKDRIAILVTFSAHKEHFSKYSNDFRIAIESLKVVAGPDLLGSGANQGLGRIQGQVGNAPDHYVPWEQPGGGGGIDEAQGHGGRKYLKLILFALILGGAGGYLYFQSRKKGGGRGAPPPAAPPAAGPPAKNKKKK